MTIKENLARHCIKMAKGHLTVGNRGQARSYLQIATEALEDYKQDYSMAKSYAHDVRDSKVDAWIVMLEEEHNEV